MQNTIENTRVFIRTGLKAPCINAKGLLNPVRINAKGIGQSWVNRGEKGQPIVVDVQCLPAKERLPLALFHIRDLAVTTELLIDIPLSSSLKIEATLPDRAPYFLSRSIAKFPFFIGTPYFPGTFRKVVTVEDSSGLIAPKGKKPRSVLASIDLLGILKKLGKTEEARFAELILRYGKYPPLTLIYSRGNLGITLLPSTSIDLFSDRSLNYFSWLASIKPGKKFTKQREGLREMFEAQNGPVKISSEVNTISLAVGADKKGKPVGTIVF